MTALSLPLKTGINKINERLSVPQKAKMRKLAVAKEPASHVLDHSRAFFVKNKEMFDSLPND